MLGEAFQRSSVYSGQSRFAAQGMDFLHLNPPPFFYKVCLLLPLRGRALALYYGSCLLSLRLCFDAWQSMMATPIAGECLAPSKLWSLLRSTHMPAFSCHLVLVRSLLTRCPCQPKHKRTGIHSNNQYPFRETVFKTSSRTDLFYYQAH